MVPIAGVPLIESVIRNFRAAGVAPLAIILNEGERDCVDWIRGRFPGVEIEFIVKTTQSSLESFGEVTARHPGGPMLVSTVDAWCVQADFVRFVRAASAYPADATVLAVTPLIADESPLRLTVGAGGRVTTLGGDAGDLVTAGMYVVPERVRTLRPAAGLGRLREFLAWLVRSGEPGYAGIGPTTSRLPRRWRWQGGYHEGHSGGIAWITRAAGASFEKPLTRRAASPTTARS